MDSSENSNNASTALKTVGLMTKTQATSPIYEAHAALEKVHADLRDELFGLGDRLSAMLSPVAPESPSNPSVEGPPVSDVMAFLQREISRVQQDIAYVRDLKNRLEV